MQTIEVSEVKLTERETKVRQEVHGSDVDVLKTSIEEKGLFHPILLQNDGQTLIAGEHRLLAVKSLAEEGKTIRYNDEEVPLGHIPFTRLADLGQLGYMEAELAENDIRVEVSWQERAAHTKKLHDLRKAQAAERGEEHHMYDTANEIYGRSRKITDDILVGAWLDDDDVVKAKTRSEAVKLVEKKLRRAHREALAETFKGNPTASKHTLIHGDLMVELPKLEAGSFECIITDPPYGIGADKFKNMSATKHSYNDGEEYADAIMKVILKEGLRVTSEKAALFMFHDVRRFAAVKEMAEEAGWRVWPWPMIW